MASANPTPKRLIRRRRPLLAVTGSLLALGSCLATSIMPASATTLGESAKKPVSVALLTTGDVTDHGYYESLVDTVDQFHAKYGWKVKISSQVNASTAAQAVKDACAQHPSIIALGDGGMSGGLAALGKAPCTGIPVYFNGGSAAAPQTPYFTQETDPVDPELYTAGVAAGLLLKSEGKTVAGFVTGPELSFTQAASSALLTGMRSVNPKDTILTAYTGSMDLSGPAAVAARGQIAKGIGIMYPYLGAATFAVAQAANAAHVPVMSPGTNQCGLSSPKFAISVLFSPGYYLSEALNKFRTGTLKMGKTFTYKISAKSVQPTSFQPSVLFCSGYSKLQGKVNKVMRGIGSGKINATALVEAASKK